MIREIVKIDEDLCDGCGLCVPSCHEGAIKIVDGKAKLISDHLCDGLGACLGHCPQDAIKIEHREADDFDEAAVAAHTTTVASASPSPAPAAEPPAHAGCPGSRFMQFNRPPAASVAQSRVDASEQQSELTHWPVQIGLLPPSAPVLKGSKLLVAADCVPVACADFHSHFLRGRTVMIGCPKFDDLEMYKNKLAMIIEMNGLEEIVVVRMQVPCCGGIVAAVQQAREQAGVDVKVIEAVVATDGSILRESEI